MKKLNYLLLSLLIALSFTSCDKDDEGDTTNNTTATEAQLEGTWELVEYVVNDGKSTFTIAGISQSTSFTHKGFDFDYKVNIRTNPNTSTAEGTYKLETTTTVNGEKNTQIIPVDSSNVPDSLAENNWELINNGTQVKSTADGITSISNVLEISDTTFKYSTDLSQAVIPGLDSLNDSPIQIGGFEFKNSGTLFITLRKVTK